MAVVQVGGVGVVVFQGRVLMRMTVDSGNGTFMGMVVMRIAMVVVMGMGHRVMEMNMIMPLDH